MAWVELEVLGNLGARRKDGFNTNNICRYWMQSKVFGKQLYIATADGKEFPICLDKDDFLKLVKKAEQVQP